MGFVSYRSDTSGPAEELALLSCDLRESSMHRRVSHWREFKSACCVTPLECEERKIVDPVLRHKRADCQRLVR